MEASKKEASKKKKALVAGAIAAVAVAGVAGGVAASGIADGNEEPITGDALVTASRVALEHTGGGRVSETEVGDEDSYYEVEVTLPDGSQVDVQLDPKQCFSSCLGCLFTSSKGS